MKLASVVAQPGNPSIWEAEVARLLWQAGQPEPNSESKFSLNNTAISGLTPHTKQRSNGTEDSK